MFMVVSMFASPEQHRIFEGRGAKNQGEEPYKPMRLKSAVGEEPVVPDRDGKPAGKEHHEK